MSRFPSIKTLKPVFGDRAKEARELLTGEGATKRKTRDYASVTQWEREAHGQISYHERLMVALDEIAGTYGVEALMARDARWPDYEYLNSGDTYNTTLLFNHRTKSFSVGCWGDIVERAGNRYA